MRQTVVDEVRQISEGLLHGEELQILDAEASSRQTLAVETVLFEERERRRVRKPEQKLSYLKKERVDGGETEAPLQRPAVPYVLSPRLQSSLQEIPREGPRQKC